VIGVTLVAAMLIIPAVVARMLTSSFSRMLLLSTVIGAACGLTGMYASYFAAVPSGTMIVLTGAAVFVVVLSIVGLRSLTFTGAGRVRMADGATLIPDPTTRSN